MGWQNTSGYNRRAKVEAAIGGHSAHMRQEVEAHYRWHALYGRKVQQLYVEQRSGREIAVVEIEPGVAIVVAAWMLDPIACAAMSFGPPAVDLLGLADRHRLLMTFGPRRTCSDEHSPVEEVHHAIAVASDCLQQGSAECIIRAADPFMQCIIAHVPGRRLWHEV
jgi:hypothetical protein